MVNTLRLFIVEDDIQIAEIQRRFIERVEDVELCGLAHTLADARDQIDVLQPDLVLLDVYFPDGNGLELLRGRHDLVELWAVGFASWPQLLDGAEQGGAALGGRDGHSRPALHS